ncbi:hypothetical protein EI613_11750 [Azospirillum sp. 412522]|nr:hypothetical protein [Azospirillum sp. 412522]MBY6262581.1 hypothetical protein [Azospirillum sp. 412522]
MAKKYLESWKKAKAKFEADTGKKKPDPKSRFGKLFAKVSSTGFEKSLKAYDAAKTVKEAEKFARAFQAAARDYIPTLDAAGKAARQDGDDVYADACAAMVASLNKITANVFMDLERFGSWPDNLDGFFKSPYWYKLLLKQAKKEFSTENVELFGLIFNKKLNSEANSQDAYETYIQAKSPKEVNITSATRKLCDKCAQEGKWKAMPWDKVEMDIGVNLGDTVFRLGSAVAAGTE